MPPRLPGREIIPPSLPGARIVSPVRFRPRRCRRRRRGLHHWKWGGFRQGPHGRGPVPAAELCRQSHEPQEWWSFARPRRSGVSRVGSRRQQQRPTLSRGSGRAGSAGAAIRGGACKGPISVRVTSQLRCRCRCRLRWAAAGPRARAGLCLDGVGWRACVVAPPWTRGHVGQRLQQRRVLQWLCRQSRCVNRVDVLGRWQREGGRGRRRRCSSAGRASGRRERGGGERRELLG
jgi:hypothetical protein